MDNTTNILIIDDDRVSQIYLEELIRRLMPSASVFTADSGSKALDLIAHRRFHYIFSDIVMPGLSGDLLFKELKSAVANCPDCRIIAISGYSNTENEKIKQAGASRVLSKPVHQALLAEILNLESEQEFTEKEGASVTTYLNPHFIKKLYKNQPEKLVRVLKLYQQALPGQFEQLQSAWKAGKKDELRNQAHTLKNSFNYLGLEKLKELAIQIEDHAEHTARQQEIAEAVSIIYSEKQKIQDELVELIKHYEQL